MKKPKVLMLVHEADVFAQKAHDGQIDRDGKPHYDHCQRVASRIATDAPEGIKQDAVTVAFLHDVLEDTEATYGDIENKFGTVIANAVLAMTHLKAEENYRQFIIRAARNPIARVVKVCDIQDNLGRKDAKSFHKHDLYLWALDYLQSYHD